MLADADMSKKVRRAKVTYSYTADNSDELTLLPGQVYSIRGFKLFFHCSFFHCSFFIRGEGKGEGGGEQYQVCSTAV